MAVLPCGAIITPEPVAGYAHLKEPLRSKWIQCITCGQVPTETVYSVHIPSQVQGGKRSHGVRTACCSEECARKWIAAYEPRFSALEEWEERRGGTLLPTQETSKIWIHVSRKTGEYPDGTDRSGKWLIWLRAENIDRYWQKIKEAVDRDTSAKRPKFQRLHQAR